MAVVYDREMRWMVWLVVLVGCRQILGFEEPVRGDATNTACGEECSPGVCDPLRGCVECTPALPGACTGTTPVCGTDDTCHPCAAHAECASNACLVDGACAAMSEVAYVAANGIGLSCTRILPCNSLTTALGTTKPVIKVEGVLMTNAAVLISRDVTIVAEPGAGLVRSEAGPALSIGAPQVAIADLIVQANGDAISTTSSNLSLDRITAVTSTGLGVTTSKGSLVMRHCIVAGNQGGGVSTSDTVVDISNSVIAGNGTATSNVGGLAVQGAGPGSRIVFDTIANNTSLATTGVSCSAGFSASNNIVAGNALDPLCTFDHSLFDNTTTPFPPGIGNISGNPQFQTTSLDTISDPTFYRLMDGSDAIDKGIAIIDITDDIDGDVRPAGAAPDIGADEH